MVIRIVCQYKNFHNFYIWMLRKSRVTVKLQSRLKQVYTDIFTIWEKQQKTFENCGGTIRCK